MLDTAPSLYSLVILGLLTLSLFIMWLRKDRPEYLGFFQVIWALTFIVTVSEWASFRIALWVLALFSFFVLREFFSLVDIRLEDRFGILISYLAIPFTFYLVHIGWYGLFIIAIPVYTFLLIPFVVALGKKSEGIVFSVGVLDFGLFFYVFCMGHLAYLMFYSERMALLSIAVVAVADLSLRFLARIHVSLRLCLPVAVSAAGCFFSARWSGIPATHAVALGIILPLVAAMGHFSLKKFEADLGIRSDRLQPGRGRFIEATKLQLFAAPVAFHYLRWFLKWGEL